MYVENMKRIVNEKKMWEKNGFKEVGENALSNLNGKLEFLTTMVFRTSLPDDFMVRINFQNIENIFWKMVDKDVYAFVLFDKHNTYNYAIGYRKNGMIKFRQMRKNSFLKFLNEYENMKKVIE